MSCNYDPGNPEDTVQAADAGRGGRSDVAREPDPQGQPSGLPGTGGGPGWLGRLLGGGGHGVVTRTVQEAGPGSDACRLERKDSLSD